METKVISYSLFEPKNINSHLRFWDKYNGFDRYWYNIPAVISLNSLFYPEFKQIIHISSSIKNNPLFKLLETINENFDNLEICELEYDYENTEPTLWRYKPLFDKSCDLILCRDIDSIPNQDELLATKYFISNEKYQVHTLRTHTNHTTPPTIILAGLCGYRPKFIPFIQSFNFSEYYNHVKTPHWGLDQNSLISIFIRSQEWTREYFLDSPISTEIHRVGNPLIQCQSYDQNFYRENVILDNKYSKLIDYLNYQTSWGGEPSDIRGEKLRQLLSFGFDPFVKMSVCISKSDQFIQDFYL